MRTFNEYVQEKDTLEPLATILLENGIDVDEFCDALFEIASNNTDEEVILNELLNTLANMGRGAMNAVRGAFGSVGQGAQQGIAQAGQRALQASKGLGNAAMSGAKALGQGAMNAVSAVGDAATKSAQPVVNSYMQGAQSGQIKQAMGSLQTLQQQLKAMKFVNPEVDNMFRRISLTLQKGAANLQGNSASRFGVGDNAVWQKPTVPYAKAVGPAPKASFA